MIKIAHLVADSVERLKPRESPPAAWRPGIEELQGKLRAVLELESAADMVAACMEPAIAQRLERLRKYDARVERLCKVLEQPGECAGVRPTPLTDELIRQLREYTGQWKGARGA